MTNRNGLAAVAAAVLAAACGKDSCPTTSANAETQNMADPGACTAPAPQQVAIRLNLCEACSHTDPSCGAQISGPDIFLDAKWEVCTDKSSCAANACATVTCSFSVPSGAYTVTAIDKQGNPKSFSLTTTPSTATCSGML